MTAPKTNV